MRASAAVELFAIKSLYTNSAKIQFTWELKDYEAEQLTFQLHFADPKAVSSQQTEDLLAIRFTDQRAFKDLTNNFVKAGMVAHEKIPRQMSLQQKETMENLKSTASESLIFTLIASFSTNFLFASSISNFFGTIEVLQVMSYQTIVNVVMPGKGQQICHSECYIQITFF